MVLLNVHCPVCQLHQVVKFGLSRQKKQRYRCQNTNCSYGTFILDYENKAYLIDVKQKIIEMLGQGHSMRQIAGLLGISVNTVLAEVKKNRASATLSV